MVANALGIKLICSVTDFFFVQKEGNFQLFRDEFSSENRVIFKEMLKMFNVILSEHLQL